MSMLVRKGTMLHRNPSRRSSRGRRASRGSISANSSFRSKKTETASTSSASGSTTGLEAEGKERSGDYGGKINSPYGSRRKSTMSMADAVEIELRQAGESHHGSPHMSNGCSTMYLTPNPIYATTHLEMHSLSPNSCELHVDEFSNRRTSSISQVVSPGEDRRRLYRYSKFVYDSGEYGSLIGQMKEATEEATSGYDFTKKFFSIICKSAFATTFFVILAILPLSMAFIGVKNLQECPIQPHLPIYFLVCGIFGLLRVIWAIYEQMKLRRYEHCNASFFEEDTVFGSTALKVIQWTLNGFILFWFLLGNIWIAGLRGPNNGPPQYIPTLQGPNGWCSKQLYLFSVAHLYFIYGLASIVALMWILSFCVIPIQHRFNK